MKKIYQILNIFIILYCLNLLYISPNSQAENIDFGFLKIEFQEKTFSSVSIIDSKTKEIVRKNVFTWQKQKIPVGEYSLELDISGFKIIKDNVKIDTNQTTTVNVKEFGFIEIKSENKEYYRYSIFDSKTDKLLKKDIISINKQIVPVGNYKLVFNIGGTSLEKIEVKVEENKITTIHLNDIGHIILKSYDNLFHQYQLLDPITKKTQREKLWTNYKHQVVSGKYLISANINGITTNLDNIEIKPNEVTIVEIKGFGSLEIKFQGNGFNRYSIYDTASNKLIKSNILMKEKQSLPEGIYNLIFNIDGLKIKRQNVAIAPKQTNTIEIENFGNLSIKSTQDGFLRYDIIDKDNKLIKARLPLTQSAWLPKGKYTVKIKLKDTTKIFEKVNIKPNQTTELTI